MSADKFQAGYSPKDSVRDSHRTFTDSLREQSSILSVILIVIRHHLSYRVLRVYGCPQNHGALPHVRVHYC